MVPVGVYVGNKLAVWTAFIVEGSQGYCTVTEGAMEPAPAPPVCHGRKVPSKELPLTPSELHMPVAARGSGGIHPFCRPS